MIFKLYFFQKTDGSKGICGDDFKNQEKTTNINTKFILSFTELMDFTLPFSGIFVGKYALLIMSNNDHYFIRENSLSILQEFLTHNPI